MSFDPDGQGSQAVPPKLPFWHTVSLSYSTYFANFIDALRASWLWMIVAAVFTYFASQQQWEWMVSATANMKPGTKALPGKTLETWLAIEIDNALLLLAGVSIAVAWHRLMILGEHPGLSGGNLVTKSFWRYILYAIAITLIVYLPLLVIMIPFSYFVTTAAGAQQPTGFGAVIFAAIVLGAFACLILIRLSLMLPAQAVGDSNVTFRQVWARTRGNFWRLAWGTTFTIGPPLILMQFAMLAIIGSPIRDFGGEGFVARMTAMNTIMMIYYLLITPIGIGFLSHAYLHFFRGGLSTTGQPARPSF